MERNEPTEYAMDALSEKIETYGSARQVLEDESDDVVKAVAAELEDEGLLSLDHDDMALHSAACGVLHDRGYENDGDGWTRGDAA